ncbi:MAG: hypothetical protein LBV29_00735 [Azoarcus sp.]|jgi:hypothetical protein|nr:hypothetical protein [Azoarcus sp.]
MSHIPTTFPDRASSFRVAIRITHPEILPELITQQIGREPDVEKAVGGQRVTPKGTVLPGLNNESYWFLRGPESDDLPHLIDWANSVMQGAVPFVQKLLSTGGRLEYFIGCFIKEQLGTSLEPSLIAKCADLGVTLVFDMYGELGG